MLLGCRREDGQQSHRSQSGEKAIDDMIQPHLPSLWKALDKGEAAVNDARMLGDLSRLQVASGFCAELSQTMWCNFRDAFFVQAAEQQYTTLWMSWEDAKREVCNASLVEQPFRGCSVQLVFMVQAEEAAWTSAREQQQVSCNLKM